jgi:hypothetical protein
MSKSVKYLQKSTQENIWTQEGMGSLCGGRLEYLHHSPVSHRRRRKENLVLGGITGPPCQWGPKIQGPGTSGWGLNTRLMTLLCKKITVVQSKEVKTRCNLAESFMEDYGSKCALLTMMMMTKMMEDEEKEKGKWTF